MKRRDFGIALAGVATFTSRGVLAQSEDGHNDLVLVGRDKPEVALGRESLAKTMLSPSSTFKFPLALMALNEGLVTDIDNQSPVDGQIYQPESWWSDQMRADWGRPHSLKTAFSSSAVWYFRRLALTLGRERIAEYLELFEYGNRYIGSNLDNFWNAAGKGIQTTPENQWKFLHRLANKKLPEGASFSRRTQGFP